MIDNTDVFADTHNYLDASRLLCFNVSLQTKKFSCKNLHDANGHDWYGVMSPRSEACIRFNCSKRSGSVVNSTVGREELTGVDRFRVRRPVWSVSRRRPEPKTSIFWLCVPGLRDRKRWCSHCRRHDSSCASLAGHRSLERLLRDHGAVVSFTVGSVWKDVAAFPLSQVCWPSVQGGSGGLKGRRGCL